MDWWLTWHMLQGVLAFGVMLLTAASILVVWRLRGILHWKRSLSDELKVLDKEAEAAGERKEQVQALTVVRQRCQKVWAGPVPGAEQQGDAPLPAPPGNVAPSARCFHHSRRRWPEGSAPVAMDAPAH